MSLRLAFMGSPDFAVSALDAIFAAGHEVACVYSQPPRPAGRGKTLRPTPVHAFAEEKGVEVRTPLSLKSEEEQAAFAALNLDVAIVVAYGLLLPTPILEAPRLGCLNVHGSLLPRWRGAAPIQRAIMAGDDVTGVQVMQMEKGLDTGPVMLTAEATITPQTTAGELHDELAEKGAALIVEALDLLEAGKAVFEAQSENGVEYAAKLSNEETRIDWSRPAEQVRCHINGLSPFPGAWFEIQTPKGPVRVKALSALDEVYQQPERSPEPGEVLDDALLIACKSGAVRLTRLQKAGKAAVNAEEFLRGNELPVGTVLD